MGEVIIMLTEKETMFLNDLKNQEKLCIDKYTRYSSQAHDGQLKSLFSQIAGAEHTHLDTLNKMLSGTAPSMAQGQSKGAAPQFTSTYSAGENDANMKDDCYLCTDALANEKHVSSVYDTSVFEFSDPKIRDALNHIQKEEQEHGKMLYDYMAANGMYS